MVKRYRFLLVLALTLLFHALFWGRQPGINVLLFSLLLMASLLAISPDARKARTVWATGLATILSGMAVLAHNSRLSLIVHFLSLILFAAFIHQPNIRSVLAAVWGVFRLYSRLFRSGIKLIRRYWAGREHRTNPALWLRLTLIPLSIVVLGITTFQLANPQFAAFTSGVASQTQSLASGISFIQILSLFGVAILLVGLLYKQKLRDILSWEQKQYDRNPLLLKADPSEKQSPQYRTWVVLLMVINILLLLYNIIEIQSVWLRLNMPQGIGLSEMAFRGAYLFFLVVLPSLIALGYLWRKKPSFLRIKGLVRRLGFLWILQNAVVLFSIMLRMIRYIAFYGISHERLAALLIVGIVVLGLLTLFVTIREGKPFYYLIRVNSWIVYILLVCVSLVNWEQWMARYNLEIYRNGNVEMALLTKLSYKALPVLLEHIEDYSITDQEVISYYEALVSKIKHFYLKHENQGWLSWNLTDHRIQRYIKTYGYEELLSALQSRQNWSRWTRYRKIKAKVDAKE